MGGLAQIPNPHCLSHKSQKCQKFYCNFFELLQSWAKLCLTKACLELPAEVQGVVQPRHWAGAGLLKDLHPELLGSTAAEQPVQGRGRAPLTAEDLPGDRITAKRLRLPGKGRDCRPFSSKGRTCIEGIKTL